MNYKKLLAVGLAATMAIGSSVISFADEGTAGATGKLEGTVNTDVFSVVLPTVSEGALDFTLDPEGLIAETNGDAYSGATFGEGTLFFANVGEDATTYSNTSDKLVVVNKSSVKADVTVKATISGYDGITLTDDKTFADDTSASMYMAIVDATNTEGVAIGENGATVTAEIAAAGDGAYELTWTEEDGYQYAIKEDAAEELFSTYEFQLTGAANAAGDWSELAEVAPEVTLEWTVVAHSEVVSYVSSNTLVVGSASVELSMPEGVTLDTVVLNKTDGTNSTSTTIWSLTGNTFTAKDTIVSGYTGASFVLTFSDGHQETLTIK